MKKVGLTLLVITYASLTLASNVRQIVERGSDLESSLEYEISIVDKRELWQKQGLPVEADSSEYAITFRAPFEGKLKETFGLVLTITEKNNILISAPLEYRSQYSGTGNLSVQFFIKKDLLENSALTIRCGSPLQETSYIIYLVDYVKISKTPLGDLSR